jgi:hypothetical protein
MSVVVATTIATAMPPAIMTYSMAVATDVGIHKRLKDARIQPYLTRILPDLLPLLVKRRGTRAR